VCLLPATANTQPAFGSYLAERPDGAATPMGLFVLTMAGDHIQAVTRFHLDALYPRFGLPGSLPAPAGPPAR
jgi:RNA polymerase sigma-70 factor (ECF subfamily)